MISAMHQKHDFKPVSLEPKWGNSDQMVSLLRNFLDLHKPDSISSSPPQAHQPSSVYNGIGPAVLQKGLVAHPLPKKKTAHKSFLTIVKHGHELDTGHTIEANDSTQCDNNVVKADTLSELFPCKDLVTISKDKKPVSKKSQCCDDIFDPFAFGDPLEDSLSELADNVPRPSIHPKELDTFSPIVGFSEDLMVTPVLVPPQLDTIDFAQQNEGHPLENGGSCRKRDSAEPLRPSKKIRTTFAVRTIKEEAVVKSEHMVTAKEPVKVARSRKNNRERHRRQGLNRKFQQLIEVLALQDQDCRNAMKVGVGSKGPKWNKHDILSEAIYAISNLRTRLTGAESRLHMLGAH